jgi:pimeloyl-ACP methyl ester carboxylesterase
MEKITASGHSSFVIVGHSGAGFLAGMLAARLGDKACHVVYFAANIPLEGTTTLDGLPEPARKANRESVEKMVLANTIPYKLMEPLVRNFLCNDCGEETIKFVLGQNFQPEPLCAVNEKMSWKNYPQVAQSYILTTLDKTLSVEKQLEMAGNIGIKDVIRLEAGHMAMLSRPQESADILNSIAGRCAK